MPSMTEKKRPAKKPRYENERDIRWLYEGTEAEGDEGLQATCWPTTNLVIFRWSVAKHPFASPLEARQASQAVSKRLGWPAWKEKVTAKKSISKADGTTVDFVIVTGRILAPR